MLQLVKSALIIALLIISAAPYDSSAKTPTPPFPSTLKEGQRTEQLTKQGEYRYVYRMFFKVYDVALYTEPAISNEKVLQPDASFSLQFRYLRKIDKSIILESSAKMLERNLNSEEWAQIKDRVDKLNTAYSSVDKGDRSSLTYVPEEGTTLRINKEPVITIEGQDFATLYFRIWLGDRPISQSLKEHLLGLE